MVSLLAFLVVIGICVLSHEAGHFLMARWRGVKVHEFAFGMGPALFRRKWGETEYAFRAFPIGGFVRLEGMEEDAREEDVSDPERSFLIKKPWERFCILAGGSMSNILIAWFLTMLLLTSYGVLDLSVSKVGAVMPGYPAQKVGIEPGDTIRSINGSPVEKWSDIRGTLQKAQEGPIRFEVERGGERIAFETEIPYDEGHQARLLGIQPSRKYYPAHQAFVTALGYSWQMSVEILKGLWQMIAGTQKADITGPVGIAVMAGDAVREGFWSFISFLAVINLNLGLLNLLPFPALDGGHLVFVAGEMLTGRRFPEKWEAYVHYAGFAILLPLIAFVTWKDIVRIFFSQ